MSDIFDDNSDEIGNDLIDRIDQRVAQAIPTGPQAPFGYKSPQATVAQQAISGLRANPLFAGIDYDRLFPVQKGGPPQAQPENQWESIPLNIVPHGVGSYGTELKIGSEQVMQGVSALAGMLGLDTDNLTKSLQDAVNEDMQSLSLKEQQRLNKTFTDIGENSVWRDPAAILSQGMINLPTTAAMLAAVAAASLGGGGALGGAAAAGIVEGSLSAGMNKAQIIQGINEMPQEIIDKSPRYQELVKITGSDKEARLRLADEVGDPTSWKAGIATGLLGAVGGAWLGELFTGGKLVQDMGRMGAALSTGAVEGAVEALQSPQEQYRMNESLQQVNPAQDLSAGVAESAAQGGAIAFLQSVITGGLFGGKSHPAAVPQPQPQPVAPAPPVAPTGPTPQIEEQHPLPLETAVPPPQLQPGQQSDLFNPTPMPPQAPAPPPPPTPEAPYQRGTGQFTYMGEPYRSAVPGSNQLPGEPQPYVGPTQGPGGETAQGGITYPLPGGEQAAAAGVPTANAPPAAGVSPQQLASLVASIPEERFNALPPDAQQAVNQARAVLGMPPMGQIQKPVEALAEPAAAEQAGQQGYQYQQQIAQLQGEQPAAEGVAVPSLKEAVKDWYDRVRQQKEDEGAKRMVEAEREGGTKLTAPAAAKRRLIQIRDELQNNGALKSTLPQITTAAKPSQVANFAEALAAGLKKVGRPDLAESLTSAFSEDVAHMKAVLDGIYADIAGAQGTPVSAMGLPEEPPASQEGRSRRVAENIYKRPVSKKIRKPLNVSLYDTRNAINNFAKGVQAVVNQMHRLKVEVPENIRTLTGEAYKVKGVGGSKFGEGGFRAVEDRYHELLALSNALREVKSERLTAANQNLLNAAKRAMEERRVAAEQSMQSKGLAAKKMATKTEIRGLVNRYLSAPSEQEAKQRLFELNRALGKWKYSEKEAREYTRYLVKNRPELVKSVQGEALAERLGLTNEITAEDEAYFARQQEGPEAEHQVLAEETPVNLRSANWDKIERLPTKQRENAASKKGLAEKQKQPLETRKFKVSAERAAEKPTQAKQEAPRKQRETKTERKIFPKRFNAIHTVLRALNLADHPLAKYLDIAMQVGNAEGIKFFAEARKRGSDASLVAAFREALSPLERSQFDQMVNARVYTQEQPTEPGPTTRKFTEAVTLPKFGPEPTQSETRVTRSYEYNPNTPVVQSERDLLDFVNEMNPQHLDAVKKAVLQYVRSVRTVVRHGLEHGSIYFDSKNFDNVLFDAMERSLPPAVKTLFAASTQARTSHELLSAMQPFLPKWQQNIVEAVMAHTKPIPVRVVDFGPGNMVGRYRVDPINEQLSVYDPTTGEIELQHLSAGTMAITLLHEAEHHATLSVYHSNERAARVIDDALRIAKQQFSPEDQKNLYGLHSPVEFIAEAYSNVAFRNKLKQLLLPRSITTQLISNPVTRGIRSVWEYVKAAFARVLGMSPQTITGLDLVNHLEPMFHAPQSSNMFVARKSEAGRSISLNRSVAENIKTANEQLDAGHRIKKGLERVYLGFSNIDVIERRYRDLINKGAKAAFLDYNPMQLIEQSVNHVANIARSLTDRYIDTATKTRALGKEMEQKLYETMLAATLAEVHVDRPLTDASNAHLFNKQQQLRNAQKVNEAIATYNALNDDAKALYGKWRDLLTDQYEARRGALLKMMLQSSGVQDANALSAIQKLKSSAELDAFQQKYPEMRDTTKAHLAQVLDRSKIQGPYFPDQRYGDYVVDVSDTGMPAEERFRGFYKTRVEAERAAEQLRAQGEDARVNERHHRQAHPDVMAAVNAILEQMPKDQQENARAQLTNAANIVMSDNILRATQLKRKGVRGARAADMAKTLDAYTSSSVSAISALQSSHDYYRGIRDLIKVSSALQGEESFSVDRIRNELLIRAEEVASDRNVTPVDRWLGMIGFMNYLAAPSYWLVQGLQTSVVGTPVLAGMGKVGYFAAAKALTNAYKVMRTVTKGMGFKALDDIDSVIAKLPTNQQAVLNKLLEDGVLQSTLAHEMGILASPLADYPLAYRVTQIAQTVPDMIERFNRMSMALAAMDAGVKDYQAIKDIVLASQFNYQPGNRARLLKYLPKLLGGGGRRIVAPIMMFKMFGVNMADLLYGNMYNGLMNSAKTTEQRAEARKIFFGLLATHTLAGGLFGGLGIGLAQIILGVVNGFLPEEDRLDPAQWLDRYISDHTNDYVARMVTRGLPAAVGADLSGSINLGNLLFISKNTDWSEYGGVEQSAFSLLGPVAQWAGGSLREGSRLVDGEASVADFMEKFVPIKEYRALSQMVRYGAEGLTTQQGQQFMDSVDPMSLAVTATGIRPATVSQRQERFYSDRTYARSLENRKSELIARLAKGDPSAKEDQMEWNRKMRATRNYSLIVTSDSVSRSKQTSREVAKRYAQGQFSRFNR